MQNVAPLAQARNKLVQLSDPLWALEGLRPLLCGRPLPFPRQNTNTGNVATFPCARRRHSDIL
jgi:hypothetical protein